MTRSEAVAGRGEKGEYFEYTLMYSSDDHRNRSIRFYPRRHKPISMSASCVETIPTWYIKVLSGKRRVFAGVYKTPHPKAVLSPRTHSHSLPLRDRCKHAVKLKINSSSQTLIIIHSPRHAVCLRAGGTAHGSRAWSVGAVFAHPKNMRRFQNIYM